MRYVRLIVVAFALLLPAQSWATMGSSNHVKAQQGSTPVNLVLPSTTTTGSGLLTGCFWSSGVAWSSTAEDGGNGAATQINIEQTGAGRSRLYYWANITGKASHTVTWAFASGVACSCFAVEITATNGAGVTIDQNAKGNDASYPPFADVITVTTTVANEIVFSFAWSNSSTNPDTWTAGGSSVCVGSVPFTMLENTTNAASFWAGAVGSCVVNATGTYNGNWTESNPAGGPNSNVHIVSFSEAAGNPCKGSLLLLGVGGC